ncbi:SGNH hydrolase [Cucurbitaria berberidis CBS 394.84]|uniref:SGNH hydrolase n=1 Tax=Cucurbitaria berberidis CBS 394.84 TaxID=1168544 RepID=A0A9P4GK93_9PLEO|nr:SGNH hydrolase [Cucurbitaria berberidis CBS 394.84]KAF1846744.1 SGNH hydrolase [Cucurbitaria berberidis CBS 394.84]
MASSENPPNFILFGDSLTEWSFSEATEGFGWFLEKKYTGKVNIVNEGSLMVRSRYTSSALAGDFDRIISRATASNASPTLLFTIFLGANDACRFEANIRAFIETILTQDAMLNTKIVLIAPPPINSPASSRGSMTEEEVEDANQWKREAPRYKTYMSKKRYAEGIMRIASEYEETGRVVGLDFWQAVVTAGLEEHERLNGDKNADSDGVGYDEELPPGSGLVGAKQFGKGWFADGLHLDVKGYKVLSEALFGLITRQWPELAPERL